MCWLSGFAGDMPQEYKRSRMAPSEIGNGGRWESMSPALSERPSEKRRTRAAVVGNDFTQRKGSGIHGDHTLRASARDEADLLQLTRHTCMVWQPYDCDFFVEQGYLDRIAHCIASGAHDWEPLATGCGRLIPGKIHSGTNIETAKHKNAAQGIVTINSAKQHHPQVMHIHYTAGVTTSSTKIDNNENCSARPPGHKRVKRIKMQHR